ncbi:MAG TPA: chain length determinant protein EpsF [Burkholderiaceae bacterium]|jgi:chain length determinant protein EpsF
MTITQFFAILSARWKLCLYIFFGTITLALTVSLLLPKKYTGSASVLLDVKPDPVSAMLYNGALNPGFVATQVDIIQSERVALKVVRNMKLAENPAIREQWQQQTKGEGSIEQWLADSFQRNMDVKPARESNVITITYSAADPRFAAALANAFVQAYMDINLELRTDPAKQYSSYFDARAKEARDKLEVAQGKVSEFQKANGIIATDERFDIENQRLNDLSTQLVGLQAVLSDSSSRQSVATGGSSGSMTEVLNNPVISGLQSDTARAEGRLQELSARYGDAHPQVIEAKANIAELRKRMEAETKKITSSVGLSNDVNQRRVGELRASLDAQRAKVLQMKAVRDEGQVMVRDAENAQRNYEQVMARLNQSSLESQVTQSNVSLLASATPPTQPSSPRLILNTAVATFAGVLLAVSVVLLLELMNRRVRSPDDVVQAIGVPVLGVLPSPNARRLFRATHANQLMQQRLLGQVSSPAKGA